MRRLLFLFRWLSFVEKLFIFREPLEGEKTQQLSRCLVVVLPVFFSSCSSIGSFIWIITPDWSWFSSDFEIVLFAILLKASLISFSSIIFSAFVIWMGGAFANFLIKLPEGGLGVRIIAYFAFLVFSEIVVSHVCSFSRSSAKKFDLGFRRWFLRIDFKDFLSKWIELIIFVDWESVLLLSEFRVFSDLCCDFDTFSRG